MPHGHNRDNFGTGIVPVVVSTQTTGRSFYSTHLDELFFPFGPFGLDERPNQWLVLSEPHRCRPCAFFFIRYYGVRLYVTFLRILSVSVEERMEESMHACRS